MKIKFLCGVVAIAGISFLNSCKDDELPITGISFELDEQEVTESDGTLESFNPDDMEDGVGRLIPVKLVFDRALAGDVVLEFDIDGSARKNSNSSESKDFAVEDGTNLTIDGTQITLLKGSTDASFNVRVYEDYLFELDEDSPVNDDDIPYETVELSLTSVASGPGKLGEKLVHTLKILEDDAYVFLTWNPGDQAGTVGDVDMDLFIYINEILAGRSEYTNDEAEFEAMIIPGGFPAALYGARYIYKAGTSNDVDLEVEIANYGGTITKASGGSGVVATFAATYTSVNKKPYDPNEAEPQIEQTMSKSGLNFTNLTEIAVPALGSRVGDKGETSKLSKTNLLKSKISSVKPKVIRYIK